MSLAEVLAGYEGLPGLLLDIHVDDGAGHCAACTRCGGVRPTHPCPTRSAAVRALRIQVSRIAYRPLAKGTSIPLA
jgi:hypothetical protein